MKTNDVVLGDGLIEDHGQVATQVVGAHPKPKRPQDHIKEILGGLLN